MPTSRLRIPVNLTQAQRKAVVLLLPDLTKRLARLAHHEAGLDLMP
jgi:hypothetical protein